MGSPDNLHYSSAFNYQKIAATGSQVATVGASITGTTPIVTFILPSIPSISIWRVFIDFNGEVYELTYFDTITNAWLYSYVEGDILTVACDESVASFTATFYYRVYLSDGS